MNILFKRVTADINTQNLLLLCKLNVKLKLGNVGILYFKLFVLYKIAEKRHLRAVFLLAYRLCTRAKRFVNGGKPRTRHTHFVKGTRIYKSFDKSGI